MRPPTGGRPVAPAGTAQIKGKDRERAVEQAKNGKKLDDVQLLSRSSTALPPLHSDATNSNLITPAHGSLEPTNGTNSLPGNPQLPPAQPSRGPSLSFRRTRRERAAESILSSIRRRYATFVDVASYAGLGLVIYAALYLLLGRPMLPPGEGWALFLLWVCAHIGGFAANKVNLPPLLGMLIAGIILRNIPQDPVHGLPTSWGTKIRTGGLAVILLRAGLKIDKIAFARAGKVVLRLALIPMLCEALVDGGCYYWLFGMPIALALTAGFIQSAISPTVLVTGMLELQRRGYGQEKVIPSIEMAAAGLDSIGAIVGYAVCSGISITSGSLVYSILSGPLQVVYGLILGLVGCFICSLTRIWNNGFKRAAAVLFCGLAIMWLGLKLSYLGASSVGCLSLAVMVSTAWERGFPPRISKGARKYYPKDCDSKLTVLWIILVQPLLFGAIGIEIDFRAIQGSLIWKTVIILALGMVATRLPAAFLVLFKGGFTWREQTFMAFSWVPKATIQGALGSAPLMLIQTRLRSKPDYEQYEEWGNMILHATAFSIILSAPVGLLVIALLGPVWLKQGSPPEPAVPHGSAHTRPNRLQSRSRSLQDDDDVTYFPDDASVSTTADIEDQNEHQHERVRGQVELANGVLLPSNECLQTSRGIAVEGTLQMHVVVASRQSAPNDIPIVAVAPQYSSPFAASNVQTRLSSLASE
ncbi:hypothetical protein ABBQ32_007644 [Trebouxia sp. C0010 RCD-2024]